MRLFHGSLQIIDSPRILLPNRTLDFGSGFYTTSSFEQAERWVKRKMNEEVKVGYVSEYEWNEDADLDILSFPSANHDWVSFVLKNRTQLGFEHGHDVVRGPVANDRVYAAFALFEQGFLQEDALIRELRTYQLVDQVLFHTEKSLSSLCFIKFTTVK